MSIVTTILHVLASIFLVLVVLLQQGKGADMGAVFGGSSSTVFGSSGAGNFLTRMTAAMAAVFMLTSLTLTYLSAQRVTSTVMDSAPLQAPPPLEQPAAPAANAPAPGAAGEAAPAAAPAPQAAAEPVAPAAPAAAPPAAAAPAQPAEPAPQQAPPGN